jgi:ribonucleotide reductase beta subunit family protein with ferritin-like domain
MAVLQDKGISYGELYRRWEGSQWSATQIDLVADAARWHALTDSQRDALSWLLGMFLSGEDAVASDLAPYIEAAPTEEQRYFLATQQADEARHSVFFARYAHEVMGVGDAGCDAIGAAVSNAHESCNFAYRAIFRRLRALSQRLHVERDIVSFAEAVCMYHLVVEAALAQAGQHHLELATRRLGGLPGLEAGIANVARDEQRHVAFGVLVLSELFATNAHARIAVSRLLAEVLPYTGGVFRPAGRGRRYDGELGFSVEDITSFGLDSLRARLRTAGFQIDEELAAVAAESPSMAENAYS